jgi:CheY-like chemotaxis protein
MQAEHSEGEVGLDDVRVVVVDSRRERRQVIRRLLEHFLKPAEIAEADSRPSAIELVHRCHPDIVVVEIQMPLEEGLQTIAALSVLEPRPRIVVYSFHHDAATILAALDRGADAYVTKPAGLAELRTACGMPLPERSPVAFAAGPGVSEKPQEGRSARGGLGARFPSMIDWATSTSS